MVGAHRGRGTPEVMQRLVDTNLLRTIGYGYLEFSSEVSSIILESCGIKRGVVYFLEGDIQVNAAVIGSSSGS